MSEVNDLPQTEAELGAQSVGTDPPPLGTVMETVEQVRREAFPASAGTTVETNHTDYTILLADRVEGPVTATWTKHTTCAPDGFTTTSAATTVTSRGMTDGPALASVSYIRDSHTVVAGGKPPGCRAVSVSYRFGEPGAGFYFDLEQRGETRYFSVQLDPDSERLFVTEYEHDTEGVTTNLPPDPRTPHGITVSEKQLRPGWLAPPTTMPGPLTIEVAAQRTVPEDQLLVFGEPPSNRVIIDVNPSTGETSVRVDDGVSGSGPSGTEAEGWPAPPAADTRNGRLGIQEQPL